MLEPALTRSQDDPIDWDPQLSQDTDLNPSFLDHDHKQQDTAVDEFALEPDESDTATQKTNFARISTSSRHADAALRKSRLFSVPETAYGGLGTFLPYRLLPQDDSNAATRGSNTPRPEDGTTTKHQAVSDNLSQVPRVGLEDSDGPHSDDDGPVVSSSKLAGDQPCSPDRHRKVSWGPGGLAYIVDTENDSLISETDAVDATTEHATHDGHSRPSQRCSLSSRFSQRQSGNDPSPGRAAYRTWNVGHQYIQEAMRIARLKNMSSRLPRADVHVIDAAGKHIRAASGMYLLSDDDLQVTLESVLEGLCKAFGTHTDPVQPSEGEAAGRSELQRPKLDPTAHAFVPRNNPGADSATTISVPDTSYAKLDLEDQEVRTLKRDRGHSSGATTVITNRRVSRITWEEHNADLARESDDQYFMSHPAKSKTPCSTAYDQQRARHSAHLHARHYAQPISLQEFANKIRKAGRGSSSDENGPRLTSFPQLPTRHCTNDWLAGNSGVRKPSGSCDQARDSFELDTEEECSEPLSTCLSNNPWITCRQPQALTDFVEAMLPEGLTDKQTSQGPNTRGKPLSADSSRLGLSLGLSSHRRRSSALSTYGKAADEAEMPSLLEKIRKSRHKLFHPHHSAKEAAAALTPTSPEPDLLTPHNSLANELRSASHGSNTPRSRDSIVRAKTPEAGTLDKAGIYEAMTGSRLAPRQRTHTCSEDCRPHVCMDELAGLTGGSMSPA